MSAKHQPLSVRDVIADIKARLDQIEAHMIWLIRADQRGFRVGGRVEWSRRARRRGFPHRKIAQKGTLKKIEDSFGVLVQLDGYTKPRSFHHAFFNPVSGPKLF